MLITVVLCIALCWMQLSLDATKAFDRVEYSKLFRLLMSRNLPPVIIRVLLFMYTHNSARVMWNGVTSKCFAVLNGVKQGGVLSPILFFVYFDSLMIRDGQITPPFVIELQITN